VDSCRRFADRVQAAAEVTCDVPRERSRKVCLTVSDGVSASVSMRPSAATSARILALREAEERILRREGQRMAWRLVSWPVPGQDGQLQWPDLFLSSLRMRP
jgi:hypothetical protein